MGELHDKHYYKKKTWKDKRFELYLSVLTEPLGAHEIAARTGVEYKVVFYHMKEMFKLGLVRKYDDNGKTVYIRKLEI